MSAPKPYADLAEAPAGTVIVLSSVGAEVSDYLRQALPNAILVKMHDGPGVLRNPFPRFVCIGSKMAINLPFDLQHEYLGTVTAPTDPDFHKVLAHLGPAAVEAFKDFYCA